MHKMIFTNAQGKRIVLRKRAGLWVVAEAPSQKAIGYTVDRRFLEMLGYCKVK